MTAAGQARFSRVQSTDSRLRAALLAAYLTLVIGLRLAASPVGDMTDAAKNFLAALTPEQRAKAAFAADADERQNWHFIPKERLGLTMKEMTPAQRHLAYGLLSSGLSSKGYLKATTIMSLEQVLQDMEGTARRFPRDPELYHFSVFGSPDVHGTWGWRVEGHHLSLNFTLVEGAFGAGTPSFMGTNPAEVRQGSRAGLRVLGAEEDLGRALVKSLDESQRNEAVFSKIAPEDVVTGAERVAAITNSVGVLVGRLDAGQQAIVDQLLREYCGRLRAELASVDLAQIDAAGRDRIRFAWAGGFEKGEKNYFRLQGPTFLLEYDNTQNDGNHAHSVWRNFANDFGRDVLKAHLERSHGK